MIQCVHTKGSFKTLTALGQTASPPVLVGPVSVGCVVVMGFVAGKTVGISAGVPVGVGVPIPMGLGVGVGAVIGVGVIAGGDAD